MRRRLEEEVRDAVAAGGPLARTLARFTPRPGQLQVAMGGAGALARGEILVAEAGTGSGKTLAYLIPSVLSGRKTIVSTGTKTLQHQIVENDLPLVREALRAPFSCVVVKGRGNYRCRRRWKRFAAVPRRARSADLGVVNHHLYFADLVIRRKREGFPDPAGKGGWDRGGDVLPLADAVIFDEAHGIEETASSFFGVSVSLARALELVRDLRRAAERDEQAWRLIPPAAEEFRRAADARFRSAGSR